MLPVSQKSLENIIKCGWKHYLGAARGLSSDTKQKLELWLLVGASVINVVMTAAETRLILTLVAPSAGIQYAATDRLLGGVWAGLWIPCKRMYMLIPRLIMQPSNSFMHQAVRREAQM